MDASFTCNICDGKFSRKDNLKRHMRTHETLFKDDRCIDVRTMCNFPGCTESFLRKVDFVKYLTDRRKIACSVESYTFASELEFQNWKEKEEVENLVYFSKQRGDRCCKKFRYVYYSCQRDGAERIHRDTKLMTKKIIIPRGKCTMEV